MCLEVMMHLNDSVGIWLNSLCQYIPDSVKIVYNQLACWAPKTLITIGAALTVPCWVIFLYNYSVMQSGISK